jgi:hypothetical protein
MVKECKNFFKFIIKKNLQQKKSQIIIFYKSHRLFLDFLFDSLSSFDDSFASLNSRFCTHTDGTATDVDCFQAVSCDALILKYKALNKKIVL